MIEDMKVEAFGSTMPLKSLANISVIDNGQGLAITAWDPSSVSAIKQAISNSDMGVNPNIEGSVLRLKFPSMTEETRTKRVKAMKQKGEEANVAVRNHRREAQDAVKQAEKDKSISEDQARTFKEQIDKATKDFEKTISDLVIKKEKELMEI
jgi:ribosome recycling factor